MQRVPSSRPAPAGQGRREIVAEIIGDNSASAEGVTVQGAAPVLALCRRLVAAGFDPDRPLHAFRGTVFSIVAKSIGAAAEWTVKERGNGPALERWVPFPAPPVAPPVRKTRRAAP